MHVAPALICLMFVARSDVASRLPRWEQPGQCGANCLYVFLKASGQSVSSYDEVANAVPIQDKRGSSLSDLADAAQGFGAKVEMLKVAPEDLPDLTVPFIAHLDLLDSGGAGHFITVYRIDREGAVRYIDGTSGLNTSKHLDELKPRLTGYVLAVPKKLSSSALPLAAAGLASGLLFGALAVKPRNPSPSRARS